MSRDSPPGVPDILGLLAKKFQAQLFTSLVHIDSIAAARALLPMAGYGEDAIDDTWEKLEEGEFLTVFVDPKDGRRTPVK